MNEQDLNFIMEHIKEVYPIRFENSEPEKKLFDLLRDFIQQSQLSPAQVLAILALASRVSRSENEALEETVF